MINVNDLGLSPEETFTAPVNLDEIPDAPNFDPPQPGRYLFQLPKVMDGVWPKGPWQGVLGTKVGDRLKLNFRYDKDSGYDGRLTVFVNGKEQKVACSLTNIPIGKSSKLDQLLHALGYTGKLSKNQEYINAFLQEGDGQFRAKLIYTASNKDTKARYSSSPWKSKTSDAEAKPIPKGPDGKFPLEFVDETGQLLRCFIDLQDFAAV